MNKPTLSYEDLCKLIDNRAANIADQIAETKVKKHEAEFRASGSLLLIAVAPALCLAALWVIIALQQVHPISPQ